MEAVRERHTLAELAMRFEIAPVQLGQWKKQLAENAPRVFERTPMAFSAMIRLASSICALGCVVVGHGQWNPLGSGMSSSSDCRVLLWETTSQHLYAFGRIDAINGVSMNHAAYWDGISWFPMGSGVDPQPVIGGGLYNGNIRVPGRPVEVTKIVRGACSDTVHGATYRTFSMLFTCWRPMFWKRQ